MIVVALWGFIPYSVFSWWKGNCSSNNFIYLIVYNADTVFNTGIISRRPVFGKLWILTSTGMNSEMWETWY